MKFKSQIVWIVFIDIQNIKAFSMHWTSCAEYSMEFDYMGAQKSKVN